MLIHLADVKYTGSWSLNKTADEIMGPNIPSTHMSSQIYVGTARSRHGGNTS